MSNMEEARDILCKFIERAITRDDVSDRELDAIDWGDLFVKDRLARDCWLELRQWISDEDLRRAQNEYEESRRGHLAYLLERLRQVETK